MEELVSVVAPVYNVEKYLSKCIDSIVNQSYKNLEIILVDDGSKDSSGLICDGYKNKDNRIKVIHKSNGGLSSARNAGIKIATGKYITFIDSDDYYEVDAINNLHSLFDKEIDIGCMDFIICSEVNDKKDIQSNNSLNREYISSIEFLKKMLSKQVSVSSCVKMYKKNIFKDCLFLEGRLNEDFLFNANIMMNDYKVGVIDYAGYNYLQRQNSITKDSNYRSLIDSIYNLYEIKDILEKKEHYELIDSVIYQLIYQARTILICLSDKQYKENKDTIKLCHNTLKTYKKYIKKLSLKDRLFCYSYLMCPSFAKCIKNIVRKHK